MGKSELIEKQHCYLKVAVLISPFCQKTDTFSTPPRRSQPLNSLSDTLGVSAGRVRRASLRTDLAALGPHAAPIEVRATRQHAVVATRRSRLHRKSDRRRHGLRCSNFNPKQIHSLG